jgi:cobyrinic acid a,c-diamide synthase
MFARTHSLIAPWTIVRADNKHSARINVIKDILFRFDYQDKNEMLILPDADIVFNYKEEYLQNGMIVP